MSKTEELEKLIEPVVKAQEMELVDLQYVSEQGKKVLRVFLDKKGGMQLSDCERVSGLLGELLDTSELLPESYVLEVSSPGIDRVLKKEKDFVRFKGERVRITLYAPIEGQRNFLGPIVEAGNGAVTIADVSGKQVVVPLDKIARARLDPQL
jgi:ribosome maturation factor RimP